MGAVSRDVDVKEDEKSMHKVQITKSFCIGKYPVTQEEWENVMSYNQSEFKVVTERLVFKKVVQVNFKNPVEENFYRVLCGGSFKSSSSSVRLSRI